MNTWPKIVPWLEVNRGTPEELANARGGLRHWQDMTDRAIISTEPGKANDVYPQLHEMLAEWSIDIEIIGGMKGAPIFDSRDNTRLDEFGAWKYFGAEVTAVLQATGYKTVLLEMESALNPVIYGHTPIDWGAYGACLHHLPPDCEAIWYPPVWSGDPVVRKRQVKLCELAGSALRNRIRWTDLTINRPSDVHASTKPLITARLDAIQLDYTFPMTPEQTRAREELTVPNVGRFKLLYTYGGAFPYWPYDQIVDAVRLVQPPDVVLLYPHSGPDNWVEGSRQIVARLLKAGYPRNPVVIGGKPTKVVEEVPDGEKTD